ncbi:GIY-YIG nuclease family protein [Chthonobacter albigriseus]|uniref:GIY-YIG nuclease family protein n=1 Tax=Chthonobacter albigriseus TaxID=1683161 RepID=UPI0015EECF44|nr:GIY-YIG nuclease family protein [Chthonobacter albigriseus]
MLRSDWIENLIEIPSSPGIYLWQVAEDSYVGKTMNLKRRVREYRGNLVAQLTRRDYHIVGRDFRPVHKAMLKCYEAEAAAKFSILQLVSPDEIHRLREFERSWIDVYQPTLNGKRRQ